MSTIQDLRDVPLSEIQERGGFEAIVSRLVPDDDTQRVSVAAFNSSI